MKSVDLIGPEQVSVVATTRWLQRDQTLPLSAKGVACETSPPPQLSLLACFNIRIASNVSCGGGTRLTSFSGSSHSSAEERSLNNHVRDYIIEMSCTCLISMKNATYVYRTGILLTTLNEVSGGCKGVYPDSSHQFIPHKRKRSIEMETTGPVGLTTLCIS